jgi:hypothetical protein
MKRKLSRRICEAKLLRGDAACVSLPKPTMSNSWTTKPNRFSVLPKLNPTSWPVRLGEERDICPSAPPVNHSFEAFFNFFCGAENLKCRRQKNTQSETLNLFRTRERFDWRRGSLILSSISAVNHLFLFLPEERLVRLPSESDKETPVSASISDRRVRVVD